MIHASKNELGCALPGVFLVAWLVMLCLGGISHMTGWPCAIGYWPTFLTSFILTLVGSLVKS